jgi:hypothetical protein
LHRSILLLINISDLASTRSVCDQETTIEVNISNIRLLSLKNDLNHWLVHSFIIPPPLSEVGWNLWSTAALRLRPFGNRIVSVVLRINLAFLICTKLISVFLFESRIALLVKSQFCDLRYRVIYGVIPRDCRHAENFSATEIAILSAGKKSQWTALYLGQITFAIVIVLGIFRFFDGRSLFLQSPHVHNFPSRNHFTLHMLRPSTSKLYYYDLWHPIPCTLSVVTWYSSSVTMG